MKILRQLTIIAGVCFIAELLRYLIPLPIPASIYGIILMLGGLLSGVIRLEQVEDAADKLIEIMPVMFIPPTVALIDSWRELSAMLLPALLALTLGTVLVMGISGHVAQTVIRCGKRKEERP